MRRGRMRKCSRQALERIMERPAKVGRFHFQLCSDFNYLLLNPADAANAARWHFEENPVFTRPRESDKTASLNSRIIDKRREKDDSRIVARRYASRRITKSPDWLFIFATCSIIQMDGQRPHDRC